MSVNIVVPQLGESISEATIANITKKVGDSIKMDELLIELETDKVTLEVNAPATGTISSLAVKSGDVVVVGQVIGAIQEGEGVQVEKKEDLKKNAEQDLNSSSNLNLSPAVKRISEEEGLKLDHLSGSGKKGRITKADALDAVDAKKEDAVNRKPNPREENRVRMSKLRQTIAKRLKESQNTAAILTTFNEVDMSAIMLLRKEYQDIFTKKHNMKLGFMSFFIKACIIALKEIPAINAEIAGEEIIYKNYCDIGVAVGTEAGLVVPIIRNAELFNIAQLEEVVFTFGQKAKEGKISIEDLKGGTFTISNGGTYGSLLSTPIINPPQSGILGMHKIQERPVVINGQIVIRPMMYIALSYDHRIVDGKEAVTFLVRVKELLEDPRRLVLDI